MPLKPITQKNKICKGTGIYDGYGCGNPCAKQYNGLCHVCMQDYKYENTFDFAKVEPDTIDRVRKIIMQLKNGYKAIAYKIYCAELGIKRNQVPPEEFYKQAVHFRRYKQKVARALDYKLFPAGTKYTPMVVQIVFKQVNAEGLKKKMWSKSLDKIYGMDKKNDMQTQKSFDVLNKMSDALSDKPDSEGDENDAA